MNKLSLLLIFTLFLASFRSYAQEGKQSNLQGGVQEIDTSDLEPYCKEKFEELTLEASNKNLENEERTPSNDNNSPSLIKRIFSTYYSNEELFMLKCVEEVKMTKIASISEGAVVNSSNRVTTDKEKLKLSQKLINPDKQVIDENTKEKACNFLPFDIIGDNGIPVDCNEIAKTSSDGTSNLLSLMSSLSIPYNLESVNNLFSKKVEKSYCDKCIKLKFKNYLNLNEDSLSDILKDLKKSEYLYGNRKSRKKDLLKIKNSDDLWNYLEEVNQKRLKEKVIENRLKLEFINSTDVIELLISSKAWINPDKIKKENQLEKNLKCFNKNEIKKKLNSKCKDSSYNVNQSLELITKSFSKALGKNDSTLDFDQIQDELIYQTNNLSKDKNQYACSSLDRESYIQRMASLNKLNKSTDSALMLMQFGLTRSGDLEKYLESNDNSKQPIDFIVEQIANKLPPDMDLLQENYLQYRDNNRHIPDDVWNMDSIFFNSSLSKEEKLKLIPDMEGLINDPTFEIAIERQKKKSIIPRADKAEVIKSVIKAHLQEVSSTNPYFYMALKNKNTFVELAKKAKLQNFQEYEGSKEFGKLISPDQQKNDNKAADLLIKQFKNFQDEKCNNFIENITSLACPDENFIDDIPNTEIVKASKDIAKDELKIIPNDNNESQIVNALSLGASNCNITSNKVENKKHYISNVLNNESDFGNELLFKELDGQKPQSRFEKMAKDSKSCSNNYLAEQFQCEHFKDKRACDKQKKHSEDFQEVLETAQAEVYEGNIEEHVNDMVTPYSYIKSLRDLKSLESGSTSGRRERKFNLVTGEIEYVSQNESHSLNYQFYSDSNRETNTDNIIDTGFGNLGGYANTRLINEPIFPSYFSEFTGDSENSLSKSSSTNLADDYDKRREVSRNNNPFLDSVEKEFVLEESSLSSPEFREFKELEPLETTYAEYEVSNKSNEVPKDKNIVINPESGIPTKSNGQHKHYGENSEYTNLLEKPYNNIENSQQIHPTQQNYIYQPRTNNDYITSNEEYVEKLPTDSLQRIENRKKALQNFEEENLNGADSESIDKLESLITELKEKSKKMETQLSELKANEAYIKEINAKEEAKNALLEAQKEREAILAQTKALKESNNILREELKDNNTSNFTEKNLNKHTFSPKNITTPTTNTFVPSKSNNNSTNESTLKGARSSFSSGRTIASVSSGSQAFNNIPTNNIKNIISSSSSTNNGDRSYNSKELSHYLTLIKSTNKKTQNELIRFKKSGNRNIVQFKTDNGDFVDLNLDEISKEDSKLLTELQEIQSELLEYDKENKIDTSIQMISEEQAELEKKIIERNEKRAQLDLLREQINMTVKMADSLK